MTSMFPETSPLQPHGQGQVYRGPWFFALVRGVIENYYNIHSIQRRNVEIEKAARRFTHAFDFSHKDYFRIH